MSAKIAIVGAGAIGARHLQALAKIERPLDVHVVDPSEPARRRAADLLTEAGGLKAGSLRSHADVSALPPPDIAIVATNASERARAISDLVGIGARRLLAEKVLFTRLADYDLIERLFAQNGAACWVNCVRRAYPRMRDLGALFDRRPVDYSVAGSGWGLASNVIHHLDEFSLLCGSSDLTVSADDLKFGAQPAKRAGYVEFFGTLRASAADGSRFSAICTEGLGAVPGDRTVVVKDHGCMATVRQSEQTMTVHQDGNLRTEPYPIPLQSAATVAHVNAILDDRAPELPDYTTAAKLHRVMLTAFIDHLRRSGGDPALEECAIT